MAWGNTLFLELFAIDHQKEEAEDLVIDPNNSELVDWVNSQIEKIVDEQNKQFEFESDSTQVYICIKGRLTTGNKDFSQQIANRLLRVEKKKQIKVQNITEIQKGSLLIAHIEKENERYILLAKVDFVNILDTHDYQKKEGLPYKRSVFKTCLIKIDDEINSLSVKITDSVKSFSEYWWSEFLETKELTTDEKNTSNCFIAIDSVLKRNVKNKSKADYNELFNDLLGYFRTRTAFDLKEFLETVIDPYQPEEHAINTDEIRYKILAIKEKAGFDSAFTIQKDVIRSKSKRRIPLTSTIDLVLKDNVEDQSSAIVAFKRGNRKFIRIETETGYESFKKENKETLSNEEHQEVTEPVY